MGELEREEFLGTYYLRQSPSCFKLGRDSVLLSRFATLKKNWSVCDLGCGVGSLLLLLSQREEQLVRYGIEIDALAADLAQRNLERNGLSGEVIHADLRERDRLPPDQFHLVVSNPPYFKEGTGDSGGRARMDESCSIEELCTVAGRLLRTGGRFALVFRAERMVELFAAMQGAKIAPKRMQLLCYSREKAPYAVLVEGVKEGGAGLVILPTHYQED